MTHPATSRARLHAAASWISLSAVSLVLIGCPSSGGGGVKPPKRIGCAVIPNASADLVVRTANTWARGSNYPQRLTGIAKRFADTDPLHIGCIALQEVKEEMNSCPEPPSEAHGAICFARLLEEAYADVLNVEDDYKADGTAAHSLGLIVGTPWRLARGAELPVSQMPHVPTSSWVLGKDSLSELGNRSTRRLQEALVVRGPHRFRFYNTHLSHKASQQSQRLEQIEKILSIVRSRDLPGELPPIIAGDFNFKSLTGSEYGKMSQHFWLVQEDLECLDGTAAKITVDQIWVGKKSSFPQSSGNWRPIFFYTDSSDHSGIDLKSEGLSDVHNSPGVGFEVISD